MNWLRFADKNSKFFHLSIFIRRRRNKIEALNNDEGDWVQDKSTLNNMTVDFNSELFKVDKSTGGSSLPGHFQARRPAHMRNWLGFSWWRKLRRP